MHAAVTQLRSDVLATGDLTCRHIDCCCDQLAGRVAVGGN